MRQSLRFIKCHGSGNDFVMIDELSGPALRESDRGAFAQLICDRRGSVGADGVLFVLPSERADALMRMFNADGTEAQMCGNGLRCVARLLAERLGRDSMTIETLKGVTSASVEKPLAPGVFTTQAEIGPVSLDPRSVPLVMPGTDFIDRAIPELSPDLRFTAVSAPNPHIIARTPSLDDAVLSAAGAMANSYIPILPERANVSLFAPRDRHSLVISTYERGVGLTASCGSAMAATTLVACLLGEAAWGEQITVYNKGGFVRTRAERQSSSYRLWLSGNATFVYAAAVDFDLSKGAILRVDRDVVSTNEGEAYSLILEKGRAVLGAFEPSKGLAFAG